MSDPGLLVVAELHGLAGRAGELRELLDELAAGSRTEAGCTSFRVFAADEPGEVVLLSGWADEAALQTHYGTVHYRRYRDLVGPLLARSSDVTVHHVSATVHARDPNPPDPGMLG
jgi:quinol monooxygenase YgiN